MAASSSAFVLLGLGFNGFGQLDGSQDNKPAGEIVVTAPKQLLISSQSSFQVSISWDSIHVCAEEDKSGSMTGGRWSKVIKSAQSKLGERVIKVDTETKQGMILRTRSHTYVVRQQDSELRITEIQDDKAQLTFGVLSDGTMYALTQSGVIHLVTMATTGAESTNESSTLQFGPALPIPDKVPVAQMTCGSDHVLAVSQRGDLFSFGLNSRGQLGLGDILPRSQPTLVKALAGIRTVSIACGDWHSLVLSEFGDVYAWGWNEHGQLGHSPDSPVVAVPTLIELRSEDQDDVNFVSIGCGERHSVAVSEGGGVYTWGWNQYGQLGRSTDEDVARKPQVMDSGMKTVCVYCGHWNTLLVAQSTGHEYRYS